MKVVSDIQSAVEKHTRTCYFLALSIERTGGLCDAPREGSAPGAQNQFSKYSSPLRDTWLPEDRASSRRGR